MKRRESLSVFALSSSLHSVFFALSSKYYHCLRLLRFNCLLALASSFSYVIYSSLRLLAFLTRYTAQLLPASSHSTAAYCVTSPQNDSSYHWTHGQTGTVSSYLKKASGCTSTESDRKLYRRLCRRLIPALLILSINRVAVVTVLDSNKD